MKSKLSARYVIGFDGDDHVIYEDGEVVYEGDSVIFVGHGYAGAIDEAIDLGDAILGPGFVDLDALGDIDHAILDAWATPELAPGLQWSDRYAASSRDVFSREEEAFKRRYAFVQLILNGVTTAMPIASESYKAWAESYEEMGDAAAIAAQLGLRMYLGPSYRSGVPVVGADGSMSFVWDEAKGLQGLQDAVRFCQDLDGAHGGLVKTCLLPARIETCTPDLLCRTRRYADELGCVLRLHAAQTLAELRLLQERHGCRPVEFLADLGFLGPRTLIAQALFMRGHSQVGQSGTDELALLADAASTVVHCPVIAARYGLALESFDRYRLAGVNVALGSDTFPPDMIRVMDCGSVIGKVVERDRATHFAGDLYRAATLGGAQALGREDLGRLAPGAKADIIAVDLSALRVGPVDDPIRTMILQTSGACISLVVINGRVVMRNGVIPGLDLDVEELRQQGQRYFDKMKRAYPERDYLRRSTEALFPPTFTTMRRRS